MKLNKRSLSRLEGVHPLLQRLIKEAAKGSPVEFQITEGRRSIEKQRQLVAKGASKTMRSRHLTGHAVDVVAYVDGEVRWDWPLYKKIADHVKLKARQLEIPIEWGGDWKHFKDGPHFQLPWKEFPA